MPDVTFRGYVMALTQGQIDAAVGMLETLLGMTNDQALTAMDFFRGASVLVLIAHCTARVAATLHLCEMAYRCPSTERTFAATCRPRELM